jgi:hypothetical protein
VAILSPKNVKSELRDPDLVEAWAICNIYEQSKLILGGFYHGTNIGAGSPLLPERFLLPPPPRGRGDNAVFPTTVVLLK